MNGSSVAQLRRFWREDGIFLVLMLALFALRFWPAFAFGQLYAPFQDNIWLYGPLFSRASEIGLTGNFPVLAGHSPGRLPALSNTALLSDLPLLLLWASRLWESARGVVHAELCHLLPHSHFVPESLCLTTSCRGERPCLALRGYYRPG